MNHQSMHLLDTHPALVNTIQASFSIANDWAEGEQEIRRILDSHPEPLFFIIDIQELKLSFDDLLAAASMSSRGGDPILHHPKIRGIYFISDSSVVKVAVAGLRNPVFGSTQAKIFASVEEALADIERVMAAER